jgi:hypothetical protein
MLPDFFVDGHAAHAGPSQPSASRPETKAGDTLPPPQSKFEFKLEFSPSGHHCSAPLPVDSHAQPPPRIPYAARRRPAQPLPRTPCAARPEPKRAGSLGGLPRRGSRSASDHDLPMRSRPTRTGDPGRLLFQPTAKRREAVCVVPTKRSFKTRIRPKSLDPRIRVEKNRNRAPAVSTAWRDRHNQLRSSQAKDLPRSDHASSPNNSRSATNGK